MLKVIIGRSPLLFIVLFFLIIYIPVEVIYVNNGGEYGTRNVLTSTLAVLILIGFIVACLIRLMESSEKKAKRLAKINDQVEWEEKNNKNSKITKATNRFIFKSVTIMIVVLGLSAITSLFSNLPYAYILMGGVLFWSFFVDISLRKLLSETNKIEV